MDDIVSMNDVNCENMPKEMVAIRSQTDPLTETSNESMEIILFVGNESKCKVSTQTYIPIQNRVNAGTRNVCPTFRATKNEAVDSDEPMTSGFQGISDINHDNDMKQFGGNSLSVFSILLIFICPTKHGRPKFYSRLGAGDRLLLCLMKMKLGLTFGAIGLLFKVSGHTASTIFNSVLDTL